MADRDERELERLSALGDPQAAEKLLRHQERRRPDPYLEAIAGLPRPTDEQTKAFLEWFAKAHSWYKHLPQPSSGKKVPFRFWLDPSAGMARTKWDEGKGGDPCFTEALPQEGFHYNYRTTAFWIKNHGFWVSGRKPEIWYEGQWIEVPELGGTARVNAAMYGHRFDVDPEGIPSWSSEGVSGQNQLFDMLAACNRFLAAVG